MRRPVTLFACGILVGLPSGTNAQRSPRPTPTATPSARVVTLDRLLRAEDSRGTGGDRLQPLFLALASPDAELRRVAVRGLGRQEQTQVIPYIEPLCADSVPTVRAEAINAVAQSLRGAATVNAATQAAVRALVDSAFRKINLLAMNEQDPVVLGVMARSLGRLPYGVPEQARDAEEAINALVGRVMGANGGDRRAVAPTTLEGVVHGLYDLGRAKRTLGDLTGPAIAVLRSAAGRMPDSSADASAVEAAARIRRLAWLALTATNARNELVLRSAARDPYAQVRRLAVLYLPNVSDAFLQREVLRAARNDSAFTVRLEWVRMYRQLFAQEDCEPLLSALSDDNAHVRLAVVDALGAKCPIPARIAARLRLITDSVPPLVASRASGQVSWHVFAHALVSLARIDTVNAPPIVGHAASHGVWQVRMYAARAAAVLHDITVLARLARDASGNVREAAIEGLSSVTGHAADSIYVAALGAPDYQTILAAARALRDAEPSRGKVSALFAVLDRLTAARRENSRDPRIEIIARLHDMGDSSDVRRLLPYLRDFDPAVAERASAALQHWTGRTVPPTPTRTIAPDTGLARLYLGGPVRIRVTMAPTSGGGSFVLRLDPTIAPATVSRVLGLIARHYYDALTWHRVVPNFVIQGGSPGMSEYVGDAHFMRDEVSLASQVRGSVGISTRGRDTGDAQLFINLVDNFRLDHDYTVLAHVESGMNVVDGILEGDTIAQVSRIP